MVLVYSILAMVALLAIASFAVDWGYVQCTKSEMQRTADATSRGYLSIYSIYGTNAANANGPQLYEKTYGLNPIDSGSPASPTVSTTWGYWVAASSQFIAGTNSSYPIAVRTVVSRKASNLNPLSMPIARAIGWQSTDITCAATAVLIQTEQSQGANVPSTSDLWLAGMPNGSKASANASGQYQDTTANATAYQATTIPVTPGTYLKFDYIDGHSANSPTVTSVPPDGDTGFILSHEAGAENGVASITAPINCLIGLFLNANAPNTSAAPAALDYSSASSRDQEQYDSIQLKQPFFIGDGLTSAGASQMFKVPAGCTRLFLGTMDGYQWHNNNGNINCSVTATLTIEMKQ
ncbi:pilus assembly protein TadG-related protein [Humisphaera borealis]|uniref:Putative Flp pilus-assembly TadG-like N-terminal domain-containing protein n=1 Tax=Humisphaera borealis TaxID=2807512 RepID=A0A7M2WPJ7_9BACT|nr:pilus assembly protein TadG-related protein [Humisphaera borealis]QOV87445.1 hypothetical protein IPV69_14220 [Humisphaera borealis]